MGLVIRSVEEYQEVLGEIRRLREGHEKAAEGGRLAECEAAAASYAETLRGAELEKGRPAGKTETGTSATRTPAATPASGAPGQKAR